MSGEAGPTGHDTEHARLLLDTMNKAVAGNDLEFVQQLAEGQSELPPSKIAGHMELMRHYGAEDHQGRWRWALGIYLVSLTGQSVPACQEALDRIKSTLGEDIVEHL